MPSLLLPTPMFRSLWGPGQLSPGQGREKPELSLIAPGRDLGPRESIFCRAEGREIPDKSSMTQRERQEPKSCPECREFTGMGKKLKTMQGKDTGGQRSRKSGSEKQKEPPPYRQW